MTSPESDRRRSILDASRVDRVVAVYLAAAVVWIAVSGPVADRIAAATSVSLVALEIAKGLAFVVVTALALRSALRRWAGRVADAARAEREAVEGIRALEEQRSAFVNAVSHELRTPLTSIVGYARTLERLVPDDGSAAASSGDQVMLRQRTPELTARLVANAARLESLVLDLLEIGASVNGSDQPRFRTVELRPLVLRMLARIDMGERGVTVDGEHVALDADVARLERCVELLADNQRRHTPPDANLSIRWDLDPTTDEVVIWFDDDGPGIDPGLETRALAPFVQGDAATRAASPGIGVGLTLVERYVRLHRGTVGIGRRPGGGTRVELRLPQRQDTVLKAPG